MAAPISRKNGSRWIFLPEHKVFLAVLLLVFLVFSWIRSRSGLLPWQKEVGKRPTPPDSFVVEVKGSPAVPGIYTFSGQVGIEEILFKAGVARELIDKETVPSPLKTGTTIVLCQSSQGLRIRVRPMDPAKKILYTIPIDVNTIQADELTLIPGIGPTLAARIVRYRDRKGGFTRLDELRNVSGVGRKKLESLRQCLSVEGPSPPIP